MWMSANSPESLVPCRRNLMSPLSRERSKSSADSSDPLERPDVPEHHRTRPVSRGDDALEFAVVDGVILGLHSQAFLGRIQAWASGHRPRQEHPVVLQPGVEMHSRGSMFLDAEPASVRQLLPRGRIRSGALDWVPTGLRGLIEITLAAVLFKGGNCHVQRPSQGGRLRAVRGASFTVLMLVQRTAQNERSEAAGW